MELDRGESRRKTPLIQRPQLGSSFNSDISDEPEPLVTALATHHKIDSGRTLRDAYSLRDAEKLGSGGMGSCRTVRKRGTDQIYALKTVFAEDQQMLEEMRQECAIQRSLDHPNIVRVYESFEAEADAVHIVLELCSGGNLVERLRESPRGFEERAAAALAQKILSAIYYIHQRGFVHRDIKLDNIMYESKLPGAEPKLIDFGFACRVKKGAECIHGRYGTLSYMAPELLDTKEKGPYESSVDLWSIGVTIYTLLSGRKPFDHEDREVKKILIREAMPSYSGPRWARLSPHAVDFVKCLMHKEPSMRLSASQALRHPWFSGLDTTIRRSITLRTSPMRLSSLMVQSLQAFSAANAFTRIALEVIAFLAAPQQLREARAIFSSLDADCSGTLSRSEFAAALAQHPEVPCDMVHDIFDELDVNHSVRRRISRCRAHLRAQRGRHARMHTCKRAHVHTPICPKQQLHAHCRFCPLRSRPLPNCSSHLLLLSPLAPLTSCSSHLSLLSPLAPLTSRSSLLLLVLLSCVRVSSSSTSFAQRSSAPSCALQPGTLPSSTPSSCSTRIPTGCLRSTTCRPPSAPR